MTNTPLPENWQDLLAGYVLGNLTEGEETEAFVQLLEHHPEVRAELTELQDSLTSLPYALPQREPSLALKQKILTEGSQAIATPESTPDRWAGSAAALNTTIRKRSLKKGLLILGVMGLCTLLIGILLENFNLRQRLQLAENTLKDRQYQLNNAQNVISTLQQRDLRVFVFEGIGEAKQSSVSVMVVPQQQQATLVSHNLPALTQAQVYRLWAVSDKAKTPIYCGQFTNATSSEPAVHWSIPNPICIANVTKMMITREKAADPPLPRGTLLLESKGV